MARRVDVNHLNPFWLHYLSLEKSLIEIGDYIAITNANANSYSLKIMQLYFAVCTETESVFEQIYKNVNNAKSEKSSIYRNMEMLTSFFPNIRECIVNLNMTGEALSFKPFDTMFHNHAANKEEKTTKKTVERKKSWWRQYNAVKHERLENFDQANLGNLLEALAALHILNIIYAVSLDNECAEHYDVAFVLIQSEYQPPIFGIKNSELLQMTTDKRHYICNLKHKPIDF